VPENPLDSDQFAIRMADGTPCFYVDFVNVTRSFFGFKIAFGVSDLATPGERPRGATLNVQIGMSPEHAKSVHELLGKQLEHYEKNLGPIRSLPTEMLDALEKARAGEDDAV
jgi:hypothetical protein